MKKWKGIHLFREVHTWTPMKYEKTCKWSGLYVSRGAHRLPNNANLNKAQTKKNNKNNNDILIITIETSIYNNFKPCKTY